MTEIREFGTEDVRRKPPIPFKIDGQLFRATGSPSTEIIAAVFGVMPNPNTGKRVYSAAILINAITELTVERIWVEDPADPNDAGHWQRVDDRERLQEILHSDERQIPLAVLGDIVMYVIGEAVDIPTLAPN